MIPYLKQKKYSEQKLNLYFLVSVANNLPENVNIREKLISRPRGALNWFKTQFWVFIIEIAVFKIENYKSWKQYLSTQLKHFTKVKLI